MPYLFLAIAIAAEVAATSALKASEEFSRLGPSVVVVVGYGIAFYFLTLVLRTVPLGIAYALWSGLGMVLVAVIGIVIYRQVPDWPAVLGMALIITGVMVINLYSDTAGHT